MLVVVVSYRNSTSNHNYVRRNYFGRKVVSYRNSTSNHNSGDGYPVVSLVVSYRNSTSNHNYSIVQMSFNRLYLIEILHQTTTYIRCELILLSCILSKFYIKPQQRVRHKLGHSCCILSKFYIKPQLGVDRHLGAFVVSYRNSTSNHNSASAIRSATPLYLIEILHQTTTADLKPHRKRSCILSKFYIKPQLWRCSCQPRCVVSYRNSTSNHNGGSRYSDWLEVVSYRNSTSNHNPGSFFSQAYGLYLIEILHQTTTKPIISLAKVMLYLIEILHQTTTITIPS